MLSYRHALYAGNFADVLKHSVQIAILDLLLQDETPIWYADTHAGAGGYALPSLKISINAKFKNGIGRLWLCSNLEENGQKQPPESLIRYLELVSKFNQQAGGQEKLAFYPGSPWIAQTILRDQDRLSFYELQADEFQRLQQNLNQDQRKMLFEADGYQGLIEAVSWPMQEQGGFILLDPPYENDDDYDRVLQTVLQAHPRFAHGVYAIWYPVVDRARIKRMQEILIASGLRNIEQYELGLESDRVDKMTSSGLFVINPPSELKQKMLTLLPWLARALASDNGVFRAETLVAN